MDPARRCQPWRLAAVAGAAWLSIALLGCSSGTGGSDGGGAPSDGATSNDGTSPDASTTAADGASSIDASDGAPSGLTCTTTLSCVGGAVCCAHMAASASSSCDDPPCASGVQLCLSSTECPKGMVCGRSASIESTVCVAQGDAAGPSDAAGGNDGGGCGLSLAWRVVGGATATRATCQAGLDTSCCAQEMACANDSTCLALVTCLNSSDASSTNPCAADGGESAPTDLNAVASCSKEGGVPMGCAWP